MAALITNVQRLLYIHQQSVMRKSLHPKTDLLLVPKSLKIYKTSGLQNVTKRDQS
jgi:hypothetical protein